MWPLGLICVLLLPLLFVPLLGYAVAATRAAESDAGAIPPAFHVDRRLVRDGMWMAAALVLATLPFAVVAPTLASALAATHAGGTLAPAYAWVLALAILALPWGLFLLLAMPFATASFAASGRVRDLFDLGASVRHARRSFAEWNLAVAAIVTGWAIGLACVGLLCVGVVPGAFYAILVSAHATAALHGPGANPPPG